MEQLTASNVAVSGRAHTAPNDSGELAVRCYQHSVHLLIPLHGDWAQEHERMVAELQRRAAAATEYARTALFRRQYDGRVGVVRVQTTTPAPTIVESLLTEQGIELENVTEPSAADGPSCVFCTRQHLTPKQASMTDSGWACPACLVAWTRRQQPLERWTLRGLRLPMPIIFVALAAGALLFVMGVGYELQNLSHINQAVRAQLPTR